MIDLVLFQDLQLLQKKAKELNIDTYLIARKFHSVKELDELRAEINKPRFQEFDFRIVALIDKIDFKLLASLKGKADFIAVQGKTIELNKFAVSRKEIDFLLDPVNSFKPSIDTAITHEASSKKIPFAFSWSALNSLNEFQKGNSLHSEFQKANYFRNALMAFKLMKKRKVNALFFSGARNEKELINPEKEWKKTAIELGFSENQFARFTNEFPNNFFVSRNRIPSRAECINILKSREVPEKIINHSMQVAKVAEFIGRKMNEKSGKEKRKINLQLLIASSLLHDIAKHSTAQDSEKRHNEFGARQLEALGLKQIAQNVREHGTDQVLKENAFSSIESKILFYADKRVRSDRIVSLKERFDYLFERYGSISPEVHEILEKSFPKIIELEKELKEFSGNSLSLSELK